MNKKRLLSSLTLLMISFILYGQSPFEIKILGTWELKKEIGKSIFDNVDFDEQIPNRNSQKNEEKVQELVFFFQPENVVDFVQRGHQYKVQYLIKDSTVFIGTTQYEILKLTDKNFILFQEGLGFSKEFHFEKIDDIIEPDEFIKKVADYYDNGQLKRQGIIQGGFDNGVWIEWYETGQVKKVTYLFDEVSLMTVEFSENGEITSRQWIYIPTGEIRYD